MVVDTLFLLTVHVRQVLMQDALDAFLFSVFFLVHYQCGRVGFECFSDATIPLQCLNRDL